MAREFAIVVAICRNVVAREHCVEHHAREIAPSGAIHLAIFVHIVVDIVGRRNIGGNILAQGIKPVVDDRHKATVKL